MFMFRGTSAVLSREDQDPRNILSAFINNIILVK